MSHPPTMAWLALLSPVASSVVLGCVIALLAAGSIIVVFLPRVGAIVRRDLGSFFTTPVAYVTLLFYALIGGNSFYSSMWDMLQQDEPSMGSAFLGLLTATLLVAPVLTMRLLAEERDRGTLELVLVTVTRPWEIALAKYLVAMILYSSLMALSVFYYLAVVRCLRADIDHGQVVAGYLGLFLVGSAMCSIGLMISAFCRNAMSAVVFTLAVFFALLFLGTGIPSICAFVRRLVAVFGSGESGELMAERAATLTREALEFLSLSGHVSGFMQGRVEMQDVAYHLSVTVLCLFVVLLAIDVRRR